MKVKHATESTHVVMTAEFFSFSGVLFLLFPIGDCIISTWWGKKKSHFTLMETLYMLQQYNDVAQMLIMPGRNSIS